MENLREFNKIKILKPIDNYCERMLKLIKQCKTNKELIEKIDNIYADGFSNGSMNSLGE